MCLLHLASLARFETWRVIPEGALSEAEVYKILKEKSGNFRKLPFSFRSPRACSLLAHPIHIFHNTKQLISVIRQVLEGSSCSRVLFKVGMTLKQHTVLRTTKPKSFIAI